MSSALSLECLINYFQGFLTCAYGAEVIGRVVIVFGVCNASFSFASGYIIKIVGRPALFVYGAVMNIIVIIVMLTWTPRVSEVRLMSVDDKILTML